MKEIKTEEINKFLNLSDFFGTIFGKDDFVRGVLKIFLKAIRATDNLKLDNNNETLIE